MPSLKMKVNSSIECPGEKSLLKVCQKSTIISKNSNYYVRNTQSAELDSCIRDYQDVSPSAEASVEDIRRGGDFENKELQESKLDDFQWLKQEFLFFDPTTMERTEECTPAQLQSNFQTIFSPVLESGEVQNVVNDAVSRDDPDMAHLQAGDSDDSSRISRDEHTCNLSDFNISDMIVSVLPLDGDAMFGDIFGSNSDPDYHFAESSMWFDMAEQYMLLPFLKETAENSSTQEAKSSEDSLTESDTSCFNVTIDQPKPYNRHSDANSNLSSDQTEWFDPHNLIKDLPELSDASTLRPFLQPDEICKKKSITLVLDLDETLVHSTLEQCDDADFTFSVFFSMKEHKVYVKQRPFLRTFLERVAKLFDIVVFTASQSIYAELLLDILDPDRKLICRRFYRESCTFSDDNYTKDLTILGIELAKVAIIDNSPQVFQLQVNNGIPIKSWFDDPTDRALISLLPFLESLAEADDVRPIIANRFGNKE